MKFFLPINAENICVILHRLTVFSRIRIAMQVVENI